MSFVIHTRGFRLLVSLISVLPLLAYGGQITIVTSFPKEITSVYKTAFEKRNPDITVHILNKNTNASVAFIHEAPVGERPEIFWSSAPDAFETLSADKLLEKLDAAVGNPAIPNKVGNYPVNDPEGMYRGQALSGYGIMWNKRYLQAHKLPVPTEWSELAKPVYFGHLAMSSPSRSGTTHLTVETILQGEGWNKGWSEVIQIAGNCAEITERSFSVPEGVSSGRFGAGLVIDFFGLSGKYSGFPVEFAYPKVNSIVPASIGIVAGGKNIVDAKKFVNFTLSQEGQELLFDPQISRLPVLPQTYSSSKMPRDFPNVFEVARKSTVQFDSTLSGMRLLVVASLFDQMITSHFNELQVATQAIEKARKQLAKRSNPQAAALLKQARSLAFSPLIEEVTLNDKAFIESFKKSKKEVKSNQLTALEEQWSFKAKMNYEKATRLAIRAASIQGKL